MTDLPAPDNEFTAAYSLGYSFGYETGWNHGYELRGDQLTEALTGCGLGKPSHAEVEAARTVDHMPCPNTCGTCSRCIHSKAWWARGGRDYTGAGEHLPWTS